VSGGDNVSFDFQEKIPIYIQVVDIIKKDISKDILKSGDKLPSVRDMATRFKVNPNTIQRAYLELEKEAITYTQRGMGTYISENTQVIEEVKNSTIKSMALMVIKQFKELDMDKGEAIKIIEENW